MTTQIATIAKSEIATISTPATISLILNERVEQIDLNGKATAHSVKKALRNKGFTTTQKEVSETLKSHVSPYISAEFNGKYLTYSLAVPSDITISIPIVEVLALN